MAIKRYIKKDVLEEFREMPGVGKAVANDLWDLGYRSISSLKPENPELMYENLCEYQGKKVCRCMLYVFRLSVYYANTPESKRNPHLLKWQNWKD